MDKKEIIKEEITLAVNVLKKTDSKGIEMNALNKLSSLGVDHNQLQNLVSNIKTIRGGN
jgi:hypothetical protein